MCCHASPIFVALIALLCGLPGLAATPVAVLPPTNPTGDPVAAPSPGRDAALAVIEASSELTLVPAADVQAVLDELAAEGARCAVDDAPCFARVGLFVGAELVLVPVVEGEDGTGRLVLIEVAAQQTRRRVEVDAEALATAELLAARARAVFEPPPAEGLLRVAGGPAGAVAVAVDGQALGPLPPGGLGHRTLPGSHTVTLTSEDGRTASEEVVVRSGETTEVAIALPPKASPPADVASAASDRPASDPLGTALLWGGAAVGVAGAGAVVAGAAAIGGGEIAMFGLGGVLTRDVRVAAELGGWAVGLPLGAVGGAAAAAGIGVAIYAGTIRE